MRGTEGLSYFSRGWGRGLIFSAGEGVRVGESGPQDTWQSDRPL